MEPGRQTKPGLSFFPSFFFLNIVLGQMDEYGFLLWRTRVERVRWRMGRSVVVFGLGWWVGWWQWDGCNGWNGSCGLFEMAKRVTEVRVESEEFGFGNVGIKRRCVLVGHVSMSGWWSTFVSLSPNPSEPTVVAQFWSILMKWPGFGPIWPNSISLDDELHT